MNEIVIHFITTEEKDDFNRMIAVNKAEADAIRANFPNTHIVRTMKQRSKRHRYYCEENRSVMRFLDNFRNKGKPSAKKEGERYDRRKKNRRVPS